MPFIGSTVKAFNTKQIRKIERVQNGVTITWAIGDQEFIEGELGLDLWRMVGEELMTRGH
jgi:hypothetical protein